MKLYKDNGQFTAAALRRGNRQTYAYTNALGDSSSNTFFIELKHDHAEGYVVTLVARNKRGEARKAYFNSHNSLIAYRTYNMWKNSLIDIYYSGKDIKQVRYSAA